MERWDAYRCARLTSNVVNRCDVPITIIKRTPSRPIVSDEGARLRHYIVRVTSWRCRELVIRTRTKRRALLRALKQSDRLPIEEWSLHHQYAMCLREPDEIPDEPPW